MSDVFEKGSGGIGGQERKAERKSERARKSLSQIEHSKSFSMLINTHDALPLINVTNEHVKQMSNYSMAKITDRIDAPKKSGDFNKQHERIAKNQTFYLLYPRSSRRKLPL